MNLAVLKKKENSLRPLTEKEIQQKLYGSYHDISPTEREVIEERPAPPSPLPRKPKAGVIRPLIKAPKKETPFAFPKISMRSPWRKIVTSLLSLLKMCGRILRMVFDRIPPTWSAGILVVFFLFLGIHSLNVYRTNAMKQARPGPRALAAAQPVFRPEMIPSLAPQNIKGQEIKESPLKPVTQKPRPPVQPVVQAPPAPVPNKPFVIQVAAYVREQDAEKLAEEMRRQEFQVFVKPLSRGGQKNFYVVFLGRFETFNEAQGKLKEFRSHSLGQELSDSFVRTL